MKTILFQGDSITASQRIYEDPDNLGSGYAMIVSSHLGYEHPGEYKFINRGISGNKSLDVAGRITRDITDLAPDYMSLLIGVNDVWHGIDYPSWGKATCEDLERSLSQIIEETMAECPGVKIMLLEPYVLEADATMSTDAMPNKWEQFKSGVDERRDVTKKIADKYGLPLIPLQRLFDEAAAKYGVKPFTEDGVHPAPAGHELIARAWLEEFEKIK
ncbi:MAG: SGNH/GDSL hydrolase family protein [Clostridia bacterium]|nr:SGNH/GDSL hydrolase family protein [Clostridia bacterium]